MRLFLCSPQMYMIVPLAIYLLERLVRLVLPHVRNTELVDVKLMGGNEKVCRVETTFRDCYGLNQE